MCACVVFVSLCGMCVVCVSLCGFVCGVCVCLWLGVCEVEGVCMSCVWVLGVWVVCEVGLFVCGCVGWFCVWCACESLVCVFCVRCLCVCRN